MLSLLFGPMKITNKLVILSTVIALIIFAITFTQYSLAQEKEEETNARLSNFNHIKKFTSDGKFITSWGSEGDGDGVSVEEETENNNPLGFKSIKSLTAMATSLENGVL
jgi:hypothetical protein